MDEPNIDCANISLNPTYYTIFGGIDTADLLIWDAIPYCSCFWKVAVILYALKLKAYDFC